MSSKLPKNFISLAEAYPDIASEWDPNKNESSPDMVSKGSHKKAYWLGTCGHSWYQSIEMRTRLGYGCTICNGTEILAGFNDLGTLNPELAKEWHPTKNSTLVSQAGAKGKSKVWWLCPEGHEWEYWTRDRIAKNVNCEICCNRKVLSGFNDLETLNPHLASEWDFIKNSDIPSEVNPKSTKKYWWLCSLGHSWEATLHSRNVMGNGCSICSNKKLLVGFNDLETLSPKLATEWHPIKNSITPRDVINGSNIKVWWICKDNHEWEALIPNRLRQNRGCPYCSRQKVVAGEGDFATTHPQFLKEWNFERNSVLPSEFGWGSEKKVWWICARNHEWESPIRNRVIGKNCPYCSNRVILSGFNDLMTLNPELAKEWHPSKNIDSPTNYGAGSAFKAWWICSKGHEWKSTIVNRHLQGKGCAKCCKRGTSRSEIAFRKEFALTFSKINKDHTTRVNLKGKDRPLQVDIIGEYKEKKVVVEYDGSRYHALEKRITADIENTQVLLDNGYIVVRIRESKLPFLDLMDKHLFQISHRFSLEAKDISQTAQRILEWVNDI